MCYNPKPNKLQFQVKNPGRLFNLHVRYRHESVIGMDTNPIGAGVERTYYWAKLHNHEHEANLQLLNN